MHSDVVQPREDNPERANERLRLGNYHIATKRLDKLAEQDVSIHWLVYRLDVPMCIERWRWLSGLALGLGACRFDELVKDADAEAELLGCLFTTAFVLNRRQCSQLGDQLVVGMIALAGLVLARFPERRILHDAE